MPSLLSKLLPRPPPKEEDYDHQFNSEYSFAIEYSGPPPDYTIPKAVPLYVDRIPDASIANSKVSTLSVPVIQPVTVRTRAKLNKHSPSLSPNSVIQSAGFGGSEALASTDTSCGNSSRLVVCDREILDVIDSPELIDSSGSSDTENDGQEDLSKSYLGSAACGSDHVSCCTGGEAEEGDHIFVLNSAFSDDEEEEDEEEEEEETIEKTIFVRERPMCRSDLKKGICHNCLKGNRFMEKELCFVCGAKYCDNCVLRTMGMMQEGRKCISCIGFPIDESRRRALGKPSRLLKRLLTVSEVERIMQSEISSPVNHLQSQLVYVNGKPLSHSEFTLLQNCTCPPKKLKPGRYWYDKVAGFWGKEGHKPCQIISCQLAVGDPIKMNSSNGDTNVLVNQREITKTELWMLQRAGVQCEGNPHFWISADGTCSLEGQKNELCKIWDKPGIKIICSLLSLPTPPQLAASDHAGGKQLDNLPNDLQQKAVNKILLVGYDKSGTSTIFKQAKIVYQVPFSEDERESLKLIIQSKLYWYLGILLAGRQQFEEDYFAETRNKFINQPGPSDISRRIEEGNAYSIGKRVKRFSDWLLEIMMSGNLEIVFPEASREYGPLVEELWRDKGFQATVNRINEINSLPTVANYFLTRAIEISKTDYEPSDMDILYAEGLTSSNRLSDMEFSLPQSTLHQSYMDAVAEPNDRLSRFQVIRLHSSSLGGGKCKWLDMFEDVDMVMYTVDITQYDEVGEDGINKMVACRNLFESIVTHENFKTKNFLLLLNKMDLLEEKMERVPLTSCEWFKDFDPVRSLHQGSRSSSSGNISNNNNNNNSLAQLGFHYIAVKFKRLFSSLSGGRKLYVSQVTALEQESVDEAFRYMGEILKWNVSRCPVSTTSLNEEEEESSTMSSS